MLTLTNVSLRRGPEPLFTNASFTIHRGNKVGLIGANGSGKSSLFEAILGSLEPDSGQIDFPSKTHVSYMTQEVRSTFKPAIDYVLLGDKRFVEINEMLVQAEHERRFEKIAELHEQLDTIDGYTARARAEQLMMGLGFSEKQFTKPLSSFSGGWRIRLNLAQTLMSPADLLLLDEPTNHLDLDAIIWLSDWIKKFKGTMLLISHDREFLDECVGYIAYLHRQTIELFTGNYSAFEKIRGAQLAAQQSSFLKQQRDIAHMQDFVSRFRAKATKARQAQSRIKALEKLELLTTAHIDSPFSFKIIAQEKAPTPLITLLDANLGYEDSILMGVNLSFLPGDRYGLLGVNGAGKTTLIKTLNMELQLLGGSKTIGANLNTAYFSQHQLDELDLVSSAAEHLFELGKQLGKVPSEQETRNFLGGFNFHGDKVLQRVETFSGGEKARLSLALIAWTRPNLLLMDEPTNHLDIEMRRALTVALQAFSGALILVSHDRHLMTNAVDQFLLVENGSVSIFNGDLEDYRNRTLPVKSKTATLTEREKKTSFLGVAKKSGKELKKLKTLLGKLEKNMSESEQRILEIEHKLSDLTLYHYPKSEEKPVQKIQVLLRDQAQLKEQLEAMEDQWLALSTKLESF